MSTTPPNEAQLVAELNDLLQLDHDAVQAYGLALDGLQDERHRATLREYRADHERHVEELTRLVQSFGGIPLNLPHLPTGAFKLAVQAVGRLGGDRALLLAFKTNEGQVRAKYREHVARAHSVDVQEVLRRAADDEERHYRWVGRVLEEMGAGSDTLTGQAQGALEQVHGTVANLVEGAERRLLQQAERLRRDG